MSLVYLMLFVLVKAWGWGVNINLKDPDSVYYSSLFKPSFFITSGILAMSYFLQNIVISIMRSNRNQKNNVSFFYIKLWRKANLDNYFFNFQLTWAQLPNLTVVTWLNKFKQAYYFSSLCVPTVFCLFVYNIKELGCSVHT